jgi:hypothetical protein
MWPTSQEGGNMVHDNSAAMTAKGSAPATPVPKAEEQVDSNVENSDDVPVGTSPKRDTHGSFSPTPVSWKVIPDG